MGISSKALPTYLHFIKPYILKLKVAVRFSADL